MNSCDVAVVGGGPVGMWLAAELHRGGVRPVVLERRSERPPYSKALTIYPRTVEQFAMRGLVDRWLAEGTPVPSSHFAILKSRLDFSFLDTRYPYTLFLPQRRTEELLEEHLAELGVPYLRQHAVTGLRQDETGVDLEVDSPEGPAVIRAAYVAGCDGAASVVRAAAGIDFAGTPDTWRTILGDIELTDPPQAPAISLNQPGGSMYIVAIGGGRYRLAVIDHVTLYDPIDKPVTFGELRASTLRLAGTDFGMRETPDAWLSRVGNAARQAACYRAGRVLLAGDAAHIHYPAGGQGLNLGLQDATNLAWKLAAEIRGWAPPGLLNSYHDERYPVGLDVIDDSLAQCGLLANPSREGIALRDRFNAILGAHESLRRELAVRLSGLAIRYPAANEPAGQRVPDLDLRAGPAGTIFGLLHPARFVLLNLGSAAGDSAGFADRLDIVTAELAGDHPEWAGVRAMLIRPDGYIAWTTHADDAPPLARWLGHALFRQHQEAGQWRGQRANPGYLLDFTARIEHRRAVPGLCSRRGAEPGWLWPPPMLPSRYCGALSPPAPRRVLKVARVSEHNRRMTMPYHADVIGSLLRPRYLSEARAALAGGRMSNEEFKRIEDRAVDQAIAMQEGCGLDVVNDGELRRFSFLDHLLGDMEGVAAMPGAPVHFHAQDPTQDWDWHPPFTVTGRIRPKGSMMTIEEFSYARGRARVPVKITMPSPLVMYGAWSPEHSRPAYSDPFELFADAADIIRAEARELARLGCTYIQIDSPDLGTLVDPENRALREGLGMDTERTLTEGVDIINSVADVPGVTFGLHICKGNYESKWIASGGYEFTAGKMFPRSGNFDVFLLEYDDERSGSFEPLAEVPDDKMVVLGLVSSKVSEIEPVGGLIARIDEAARYVGRERLGLSTQCGFSPVSIGANLISEDTQERKLELVAEVAHQVW